MTIRVWRIRVSKEELKSSRKRVDAGATTLVDLGTSATRAVGLRAAEEERRTGKWSKQGLFGVYVEAYERRYRREWKLSSREGGVVASDLTTMVRRVGVAEGLRAVRLVFLEQWIERHHHILADRDLYERFVVPLLARRKGEGSEWTGDRTDETKAVDTATFFGKVK